MLVLQQLVESESLAAEDKLYFAFKDFNFQCRVSPMGLLYDCTFSTLGAPQEPCFSDRGGFSSLTDWADCCLQDLAGEYVTRFSSWKRIRHLKSNRLLSEIRDLQREHKGGRECPVYIHMQKQQLLLQQQLYEIKKRMLEWAPWVVAQEDAPGDLVALLNSGKELDVGELYVFPDLATLKQLARSGQGTSKKRRRRAVKRCVKQIENPIAAVICSNDVSDLEYQEMLHEFFQSVGKKPLSEVAVVEL